jgi:tRNA pseudouridine32 synthase/23S rRNA pseudouridine746 synthase/23S rRNA pseudouridine1911/1915/1917 synthase
MDSTLWYFGGASGNHLRGAAVLEVIHRDQHLAVLNKPANVSLLADRSGAPSLWDVLPEQLGTKPYLVHRLDKGTSGVLLVALDQDTQRTLTRAFQQRTVSKYYLAWVAGGLHTPHTLEIDLPLRKGRKSRYRVAGSRAGIRRGLGGWSLEGTGANGHPSLTRIRSLAIRSNRTLLLAAPATGRTHQLRVHLAWVGHPILGDHLYGRPGAPEQQASRLQLHCHRLVVPRLGTFAACPGDGWLGY